MRKAAHKNKLASTHGAAVPSIRPSLPLNWTPFRVSREYDELLWTCSEKMLLPRNCLS